MTLGEYNKVIDEVNALKAYAYAALDEAERIRGETITKARAFIKEKLGEDALVSVSAALYQIERQQTEAKGEVYH